jgi:dTDP-glucose 4,6-dehydratase
MILITGSTGFVGTNLVAQWLLDQSLTMVSLDRKSYVRQDEAHHALWIDPRHTFVCADLQQGEPIASLLATYRPEAIVHLAAQTHVDRSIHVPLECIGNNVMGTANLLDAARRYWTELSGVAQARFRFVHVSTDEVYGELAADDVAFSEQSAYAPNNPYAASKASADHLARAYHKTYGLPVVITHCSNNYGPGQAPEKLIPLMIVQALAGKPLPVYGDGTQVRDWLHVNDHCHALRLVLAAGVPGETYNIGATCEIGNLELVHKLCTLLDRIEPKQDGSYAEQITLVPDRPGHDTRYAIDAQKIRRELGWHAASTLDSGLEQTVHWYLKHREWLEVMTSGEFPQWLQVNYGGRGPARA